MRNVRSSHGVDLAVHELTPSPGGRPVLMAHATGFHGRVWAPMASRLTDVHVWAPDLRAHGDSVVAPGEPLDWERFADDVLATVDGIGLDAPVGAGHSKGAASLLLAEARRPGTFAGLWLYEPVVFPPEAVGAEGAPAENPLAAGARRRRARFDDLAAAEANFASKPPLGAFDPAALHAYVVHGFAPADDGGVVLKCRPEDEARTYEMGGRHRAWERLDQVTCPTVVVRGAVAGWGPASMAESVAARLPRGRLEVHDDLGHFGPMEAPAAMAASLQRLIAELDATT